MGLQLLIHKWIMGLNIFGVIAVFRYSVAGGGVEGLGQGCVSAMAGGRPGKKSSFSARGA